MTGSCGSGAVAQTAEGEDGNDRRVALVTIGQSPRPDVMEALGLADRTDVTLLGALDELNVVQVQEMEWHPGDESLPLFIWYDQQAFIVNKHALSRHVVATVANALKHEYSVVTVLCTESFPEIHVGRSIVNIRIDRLLFHTIQAMFSDRVAPRIGVLVPVTGQIVPGETRWGLVGEARAVCLPPRSDEVTVRDCCRELADLCGQMPDVVVLDCMGYGVRERAIIERELGVPVVWAVELLKSELHRYLRVSDALRGGRKGGSPNTV